MEKEIEKNNEIEQQTGAQNDMTEEVVVTEVDPLEQSENLSEPEITATEVVQTEVKVAQKSKKASSEDVKPPAKEKKTGTTVVLILACVVLALACIVLAVKLFSAAGDQPQNVNTNTVVEQTIAAGSENTTAAGEEAAFDRAGFLAPTEGVVAVVNGVELDGTLYDFFKAQNVYTIENYYGMALSEAIVSMFGIEPASLSNAITGEMLQQLAKKQGIEITEADAQKLMEGDIALYGGEAVFEQMLAASNSTREQYLEYCKYYAADQALFNLIAADITITDTDAKATYDADPSQYDTRKTSHILVLFDAAGDVPTDEEKQKAYNEALTILEKVKANPENFAELAKEYSDDGSASAGGVIDYAFTKHDTSLFAEYVAGAWALEGAGDFSPQPVESSAGYHIIKIDEEVKGAENFIEKIKEESLNAQVTEKINALYTEFYDNSEIIQKIEFKYSEPLEL